MPAKPVNLGRLKEVAEETEAKIDEQGWDRPPRIWVIGGTPESPEIEPLFPPELDVPEGTHPCDMLYMAHSVGIRFRNTMIGLALSTEAYRHLTYEEVAERKPEIEQVMDVVTAQFYPDLTEVERQGKKQEAYYKFVLTRLRGPASQPEEMRVECRQVSVVLWNDTCGSVMRDRDGDVTVLGFDDDKSHVEGRVLDAMKAFLHGKEPQPLDKDLKGLFARQDEEN